MQKLILFLLFLLLVASQSLARAPFPALRCGQIYAASVETDKTTYAARLRLLDRHFFELSEIIGQKGAPLLRRTLTGRWLQVREGSMLQLVNNQGLSVPCNVGGGDSLYATMGLRTGQSLFVTFRREENRTPAKNSDGAGALDKTLPRISDAEHVLISGIVEQIAGKSGALRFVESGSGLTFDLENGPIVDILRKDMAKAKVLFVEVRALFRGDSLSLVELGSVRTHIPSGLQPQGDDDFLAVVGDEIWSLELPVFGKVSCTFRRTAAEIPPASSAQGPATPLPRQAGEARQSRQTGSGTVEPGFAGQPQSGSLSSLAGEAEMAVLSGQHGVMTLSSPGLYAEIPLVCEGKELRFVPDKETGELFLAMGLAGVSDSLAAIRHWTEHGQFLFLEDERDILLFLEQGR